MAKSCIEDERYRIWVWGQSWDFHVVQSSIRLTNDFGKKSNGTAQSFKQRRQIILHSTAGNGNAEGVISGWNGSAKSGSAHYVVERAMIEQAPRLPAGPVPPDQTDEGLVDVVRAAPDDFRTFHTGPLNRFGIGIEVSNVANAWYATNSTKEPTYAGRHAKEECPNLLNIGGRSTPRLVCAHGRPTDLNRFIRSPRPFVKRATADFQAYDEEQYASVILLLRHLCMTHRIPRRFIGQTIDEAFKRWGNRPKITGNAGSRLRAEQTAERETNRRILRNFRGILMHHNQANTKPCPGVWNRNRLFRGITDEWWMPVDHQPAARKYYSGPFHHPPHVEGTATPDAYFRAADVSALEGAIYRDADIDGLTLTNSYYQFSDVDEYYTRSESTPHGWFPLGSHRWWHGGMHIDASRNPWVHAACSGTIVAARLTSNSETDSHPEFGSQRFVLIRHAVHFDTETEPDGTGERIDYSADPTYVFSLYMHLDAMPNADAVDERNPPWFNAWRRANPDAEIGLTGDGESGKVFAPDIMVSVGDILGRAGAFHGRRAIHFETLTHRDAELTTPAWSDPNFRVVDTSNNIGGDEATISAFLKRTLGVERTDAELPADLDRLRQAKVCRKSEWAVTEEAHLDPFYPTPEIRKRQLPHVRRFSWVADALAANPDLRDQLGDEQGNFWHYHPVTLMDHVNHLIAAEHREIPIEIDTDTNVEIDDDGFLTRFIDHDETSDSFVDAEADNEKIRLAFEYKLHFRREDIACSRPGAHADGEATPTRTKFSLALADVLDIIRENFSAGITISTAHVCSSHASDNPCVLNTNDARAKHANGLAVDFRPSSASRQRCTRLWSIVKKHLEAFDESEGCGCIGPTQVGLPDGSNRMEAMVHPGSAQAKLDAGQPLSNSEVADFHIHLELAP